MDILVKHNGTDVTSDVISYEREHKICTGIGTLVIEFEGTTNRTFDPWDSIDIHENGDFKVRYYVSAVKDSVPSGKITLDCQDLSKKLVDFFIPESYLIDYPSYTRYWIGFFLDMVDVNYQFETDSPGQLLSNFTSLGMMTAYEQLLVLLQLSGWYMFFDGNGTAIIGPLDADLADDVHTIDTDDMLSLSVLSDDRMLRNRALVLGAFDVYSMSYAGADVTVQTRWNYDSDDIRTMVVINNNIPNDASAYTIANILLKEFARITVVKRIEAHGARDYTLGDALRVKGNIWKGVGLITTFGVRMSKDGLITDIVLDERCPRLFGFFDYGDYVYVGTYGDGIWRKHIKFDPTWYNFSDGLTELRITDLHINNGVFGSVGASGQMYINTGETGWHPVAVTGLLNSVADIVFSGEPIIYSGFSPNMARATIVDKISNNIKFGVDTWSGLNMGDYFLTLSGLFTSITFSGISLTTGVTISGHQRGWILEYDPYTRALVGGLGSGIYPIHWSGYYNLTVMDLENDGINDYVSVRLVSDGLGSFGKHENQPYGAEYDRRSEITVPVDRPYINSDSIGSRRTSSTHGIITVSDTLTGLDRIVIVQKNNFVFPSTFGIREATFDVTINEDGDRVISKTEAASTGNIPEFDSGVLAIRHRSLRVYDVYYSEIQSGSTLKIFKKTWDASQPTVVNPSQELYSYDMSTTVRGTTGKSLSLGFNTLVLEDVIYILATQTHHAPSSGGRALTSTNLWIDLIKFNMFWDSATNTELYELETTKHEDHPEFDDYYFISDQVNGPVPPQLVMVADGIGVRIFGWYGMDYFHPYNVIDNLAKVTDWTLTGNDQGLSDNMIWENQNTPIIDFIANEPVSYKFNRAGMSSLHTGFSRKGRSRQLNRTLGLGVFQSTAISDEGYYGFYWDGVNELELLTSQVTNDFHLCPDRIMPLFITGDFYIAEDSSGDYWLCSASSKSIIMQITAPPGYVLTMPISSSAAFTPSEYYWIVKNENTQEYHLMPATSAGLIGSRSSRLPDIVSLSPSSLQAAKLMGPFFVTEAEPIDIDTDDSDNIEIEFLDIEYLGGYMVLQREGMEFNLVQRAPLPIRVDISNSTPVFTVTSGDDSFQSHYIYPESAESIYSSTLIPFGSGRMVNDYRYTLLEPVPSGALASGVGIGVEQMGLYITGSGIFSQNIRTYSGGWQPMFSVPSGYGTRIETSNFGLGGQYIFITSSGFVQTFYQMDPGRGFFTPYSGMPQARATIIRLDDRI